MAFMACEAGRILAKVFYMRISILTLFPEQFDSFLKTPIVSRAKKAGVLQIECVDIKSFADGCFRKIDDSPYGGGPGCILRCEPVVGALESVQQENSRVIILAPGRSPYTQADARRLSKEEHLILLCGHYEGFDARIYDYADEVISIGDYILTGGEIPAMAVMDSVVRLFPESLKPENTQDESFENGLLEYPQYTKPPDFRGKKVPPVLLSGNHEAVRQYRLEESLRVTAALRPELLEQRPGPLT